MDARDPSSHSACARRIPRGDPGRRVDRTRVDPWRKNYLTVWTALFTTSMGLMAFLPVLTIYVGERFGIVDPVELTFWGSVVYGAAPLSAAVAGPLWGALGDRVGKKAMAVRANLAISVTTAFMPLAPSVGMLLFLRMLQGGLAGYVAPAMALVAQDAPPSRQGRTIASLQAAMAMGSGIGPLVGSEITLLYGRHAVLWFTSIATGLAGLVLLRYATETQRPKPTQGVSFFAEFARACRELLGSRLFVALLLLILGLRLGQNMLEPFVALFVRELGAPAFVEAASASSHEAVERTIGAAFTVLAVAQVAFTPWWGRASDRHGPLRCLAVLALALGLVLCATARVDGIGSFLTLRSLSACFMAGSMTLAYAAVSRRIAQERRTFAFSLVQSCMQFGFAIGPWIGGLVARVGATPERANLRLPFLVAGLLCLCSGVGMLFLRRLWVAKQRASAEALTAPPL